MAKLLALPLFLTGAVALAMPPRPSKVVGLGQGGPTEVKVRRITEIVFESTTAPPPSVALSGRHQLLVVLVETADVRWPKKFDRSRYEEMLFARSATSLTEYYRENSYGRYEVGGEVVGPIRIGGAMKDYAFTMGQSNEPVTRLVAETARALKTKVDFARFDTHDIRGKPGADGVLDHLMIVYPAVSDDPEAFAPIWPHRGSTDLDLGKIRVTAYTVLNHAAPLGVFVHEFAHDIGLPDLYDRDYSSHGAGLWCLMAAGSWSDGGALPSHISAWGKARLGWILPKTITDPVAGLALASASEKPVALKVPIGAIDSPEYFMIENRRKVGFDRSIPAEGVVIWHIDDSKGHNDDEKHKLVDVVEAAPVQDLDFLEQGRLPDHAPDVFHADGKSVFDDQSTPSAKRYDGQPSQIRVRVLSPPGRTMKLDVERPKIFNPGGVPFVLEKDAYRYGRFAMVPTGKGSEALVRFDATPGGYLVYGAQVFFAGATNARGKATIRLYEDSKGAPGRVLLSKGVEITTGADGYAWVETRVTEDPKGHRLGADQRVWVGVISEDGRLYPALNPFSISKHARFRRPKQAKLGDEFNFASGAEPVPDYIIRLSGFGFLDGGERPEPLATDEDPLVRRMKEADALADGGALDRAQEIYRGVLDEMQREARRYERWIPVVVNSLGVTAYRAKKYDLAIEQFETSLRRVQAAGDRANEADIFENLGEASFFAKDFAKAKTHCDRSRRLNTTLERKDRLVENLYWLARAEQESGDAAAAKPRLAEAKALAAAVFEGEEAKEWAHKIERALAGEPVDEDRVEKQVERLREDTERPKQRREVRDLLQFLMDDTTE